MCSLVGTSRCQTLQAWTLNCEHTKSLTKTRIGLASRGFGCDGGTEFVGVFLKLKNKKRAALAHTVLNTPRSAVVEGDTSVDGYMYQNDFVSRACCSLMWNAQMRHGTQSKLC